MPSVITTGNVPKALWPGIKAFWGRSYNEYPLEWPALFEQDNSSQAFEEDVLVTGFGLAPLKKQGEGVHYDSEVQGYVSRYTHYVWGLGFIVSWEERLNNLYEVVAKRRTQALAFSLRQTHEINAASVYNLAFDAGTTGGDGQCLCSATHPTNTGSQSNVPTTAADICETALEDMITQISNATNDRGLRIALIAQSLHVPPALWWEANRILKSVLQNDTNLNAVNVLRATGALPKGIIQNHYFTSSTAYFMRTNVPRGMIHYSRYPLTFSEDNEFDTENRKYKAIEYYSAGWTDWRGVFGSNPA